MGPTGLLYRHAVLPDQPSCMRALLLGGLRLASLLLALRLVRRRCFLALCSFALLASMSAWVAAVSRAACASLPANMATASSAQKARAAVASRDRKGCGVYVVGSAPQPVPRGTWVRLKGEGEG